MKAPASQAAKSGKGARPAARAPAAPARSPARPATAKGPASKAAAAAKTAAKPAGKAAPKAPAKSAPAKPAGKPPVKGAAKPAAKAVVKAPVKAAAKTSPKAVVKSPVKPAVKAPAKTAAASTKAPAKAAAKVPAKTLVKASAKAVPKPAAKAEKPVAKPTTTTAPKSPAPAKAAPVVPKPVVQAPAPVPKAPSKPAVPSAKSKAPGAPVIEPSPPPMGKREAKKLMMEQMTQPEAVPTHAPDAAKATFFQTTERVMTAPAPTPVHKDPKRANNWKTLPVEQLTDADVLAMPDGEYMNDQQLAFFRLKLLRLKADMLANAGETTEHLREDTVVVPDPADRATIEEEHALELRTRDRERKLLKKIEQAIARIDAGDYGYCEETGEPIGVGRLMARPTASLSLEAQQRRELKQKMFGD